MVRPPSRPCFCFMPAEHAHPLNPPGRILPGNHVNSRGNLAIDRRDDDGSRLMDLCWGAIIILVARLAALPSPPAGEGGK